jgi:hypothetical protein
MLVGFKSEMHPPTVYVNPTRVESIWSLGPGLTRIDFGPDHSVVVTVPVEKVRHDIDSELARIV